MVGNGYFFHADPFAVFCFLLVSIFFLKIFLCMWHICVVFMLVSMVMYMCACVHMDM